MTVKVTILTHTMTHMQNNTVNRRLVLAGIGGLVLAGPSFAMTNADASKLVQDVVKEINRVIGSGKSESGMISDFEKLFRAYGDVPTIARYALGRDARAASPAQLNAFSDAFSGYLSRKYGKQFRQFIGGRLEVQSTRAVKSFYEVKTLAYLKGSSPFDVTFLVSDKAGRPLFFNMFIEGVNLLLTERSEIGAILDRRGGSIDKLIADIKTAG